MNNRMKLVRLVVVSIILTLSSQVSVFAQAKPNFRHITRDHGLSSNKNLCITHDKFGFKWYGTEDELTRYDGSGFVIYKKNLDDEFSLSNNTINCITEDPGSGNLWIG